MRMKGFATALGTSVCLIALATPADAQERSFDIPAGSLKTALDAYSRQAGQPIIYKPEDVRGARSKGFKGAATANVALDAVLAESGFAAQSGSTGAIAIVRGIGSPQGNVVAGAPNAGNNNSGSSLGEDVARAKAEKGISEILVVGKRSQNVDIKRTRDDPQPYVVFDSSVIKNSNSTNLDDFMRTRLPMNAQSIGTDQRDRFGYSFDNAGMINLRGLGTNQTLVLVDGRRLPAITDFDLQQSNISGIPLESIDRIEVLPSTAGAIYGGGAVGGVVNIILKRNYNGLDAAIEYGNTFDGATGDYRVSINGGATLGRTRIAINASRRHTSDLTFTSRSLLFARSRELLLRNDPNGFASPPLGTLPNILSSFIFDPLTETYGQPILTLKSSGASLGSTFTHVPANYSGPASDGGLGFLANAGQYSLDIPEQPSTLIRGVDSKSVNVNVRQTITDHLEGFVDLSWDRTPSRYHENFVVSGTLPTSDDRNPFNQDIDVVYVVPSIFSTSQSLVTNRRLNTGIIARLPHQWSLSLEHVIGRSTSVTESIYAPITSSELFDAVAAGLRDVNVNPPGPYTLRTTPNSRFGPTEATILDSSLRASGPLLALPAGNVVLSTLLERRVEKTAFQPQFVSNEFAPNGLYFVLPPQRQEVDTGYVEARIPIIGLGNARPLLRELELQASLRHDRYRTLGVSGSDQFMGETLDEAERAASAVEYATNTVRSTNYLIALRYKPIADLALRASYSTGFLPPALSQIKSSEFVQPARNFNFRDPKRGNMFFTGDAFGNITTISGGNPNLQPERSKSLSVGIILTPRIVPGFRASIDYSQIRKSEEITFPDIQLIINNESLFPGRIIRGPNLPGDPPGFLGPVVAVDFSQINLNRSQVDAIDFQLDYDLSTRAYGEFHFYTIGTRALKLNRELNQALGFVHYVGFADGPLKLRLNSGVDWQMGRVRVGWNTQFYSKYKGTSAAYVDPIFVLDQGREFISSQMYHDVSFGYRFPDSSILKGAEITGGVQNLLNKKPPAINANYGTYSTYGDPRLRRYTLSIRKHF